MNILTEKDYKYGSAHKSYSGESAGYPPALGNDRQVCRDMSDLSRYEVVVQKALGHLNRVLEGYTPDFNVTSRSFHNNVEWLYYELCFQAYFMQEYFPNGRNHLLYLAVIEKTIENFENGIAEYEACVTFDASRLLEACMFSEESAEEYQACGLFEACKL